MRISVAALGLVVLSGAFFLSADAAAQGAATLNFQILRNGDAIGTSTLQLRRSGNDLSAQCDTRIIVKVAFVTAYRFEQSESARFVDGQLASFSARTDDNGTPHQTKATRNGNKVTIEHNGKAAEAAGIAVPASLWNPLMTERTVGFDPQDGTVVAIKAVDRGFEMVPVKGQQVKAHHYTISAPQPQDIWFDEQRQFLKAKFKERDGSIIEYQRS